MAVTSPPQRAAELGHDEARIEFGAALEELFRSVLRVSGRGVPGGQTELTLSQYWVMAALADTPLTVSEVARAARIAAPTATRSLYALEERGFVERERGGSADRRLVTVALTGRGREVLEEKQDWVTIRQREMFEGLSAAERRTVASTLLTLSHRLDEL